MNKNSKQSSVSQKQKFIDKARELGCDEDEQAFADKLKRIAKRPTATPEEKAPPSKKRTSTQ